MAWIGLGLAWLPETLVRDDLIAQRLVRAAPERYDVPLSIQMRRRSLPLGLRAEAVWDALPCGQGGAQAPSPAPQA